METKFWITVCFLTLVGALYSCAALGKYSDASSEILNYLFAGQTAEATKWSRLEEKDYPSFYRNMPREYKRLNPADAYFSKHFQAGVIVVYGKTVELDSAPKMCVAEASATYYLNKVSSDAMPLAEKPLYLAWERAATSEGCSQVVSPPHVLIDGRLPILLLEEALMNEKEFLNQCFAERELAKRYIKLNKIVVSQSLGGSDAYLHYTGSGLNIILGLSLQDEGWHFNDCGQFFD